MHVSSPGPRIVERRDFIRIFSQAQFLTSAGNAAGLPAPDLPELAFAGRSNVGKSSAINALTGRKRLAFTSKTPGRTQTINFYALGAEDDRALAWWTCRATATRGCRRRCARSGRSWSAPT